MEIWCGLGNPGAKYQGNRHNIGFLILDGIAEDHNFPAWKTQFKGLTTTGLINGRKVLLLKPSTFMNESGQAVQAALSFYKLGLSDLTVLHDELDIAPGKVRVKTGGGLAGHNGLRSINKLCGGPDFHRIRLGIGHPGHKDRVAGYVLSDFAKAEHDIRDDMINGISRHVDLLADGKRDLFQTRVAEYIAN